MSFRPMKSVFTVTILVLAAVGSHPAARASSTVVVKEAVSVAFGEAITGRAMVENVIIEDTTIARIEKLVMEKVGASTTLSAETRALFSAAGALGAVDLTGRPDADQAIALVKSVVGGADLERLPALSATEMALIEARREAGAPAITAATGVAAKEPAQDAVEKAMRTIVADSQVKAAIGAVKDASAKELLKKLMQDQARDLAAGQITQAVAIQRARDALVANRGGDFLDVGAVECVTTFSPAAEAGFYSLLSAARTTADPTLRAEAMLKAAQSGFGISRQAAVARINAMCGADTQYDCHEFKGPVCAAVGRMMIQ